MTFSSANQETFFLYSLLFENSTHITFLFSCKQTLSDCTESTLKRNNIVQRKLWRAVALPQTFLGLDMRAWSTRRIFHDSFRFFYKLVSLNLHCFASKTWSGIILSFATSVTLLPRSPFVFKPFKSPLHPSAQASLNCTSFFTPYSHLSEASIYI